MLLLDGIRSLFRTVEKCPIGPKGPAGPVFPPGPVGPVSPMDAKINPDGPVGPWGPALPSLSMVVEGPDAGRDAIRDPANPLMSSNIPGTWEESLNDLLVGTLAI